MKSATFAKFARNSLDVAIIISLNIAAAPMAQASGAQWYQNVFTPNTNGQLSLNDHNNVTLNATTNPTASNVQTNTNVASRQPTVVLQATASLPIKAVGDPCTVSTSGVAPNQTANEGTAITADRSTLLTCQSGGRWKVPIGSTPTAPGCYVGMGPAAIATQCTIGSHVFAEAGSTTSVGKYAGGTLIVEQLDSGTRRWGCPNITGAASTTDGYGNFLSYQAVCSLANSAFEPCANKGPGWFLPAKDQLQLLYLNRAQIGGFSTVSYWSSTESPNTNAWLLSFSDGSWNSSYYKNTNFGVRCVRSF